MDNFKKISIIVPIFNEEKTLEKIISAVENAAVFGLEKEIILVDDGSQDKSREILANFENKHKVLYHKKNQGKGAALKTGFQAATGDIILIQDADLEYDPNEYPEIIKLILDDKADVVFSSRFISNKPHRVLYFWHYVGNKFITCLSNVFTNLNLTDIESGYKVFTKEILDRILPKLKSKRFGIEPELVARAAKLARKNEVSRAYTGSSISCISGGTKSAEAEDSSIHPTYLCPESSAKAGKCRIFEVGISYSGRTYNEGKKITWKDGVEAVWCVVKYNLF